MVSTIQGHKMVTLKMSYFMTNIVLVKRLGKIWMNFAIFSPLVSFISNWQNTMKSHIISNKYITDENPLKLGYLEIWGVGSVPISSVSVSANGMVITPPFTYSSATQVCDRGKVPMEFPSLEMPSAIPACLPSKGHPLLQSPLGVLLWLVCQHWAAWRWRDNSWFIIWSWEPRGPLPVSLSADLYETLSFSLHLCLRDLLPKKLGTTVFHQIIRHHQIKVAPLFLVPWRKKKGL